MEEIERDEQNVPIASSPRDGSSYPPTRSNELRFLDENVEERTRHVAEAGFFLPRNCQSFTFS